MNILRKQVGGWRKWHGQDDDIDEATRASKEGVKLPTLAEELKPYVKDWPPYYFIQFMDINKLGIHPLSRHQNTTPLGIYCYPLTTEIYRQFLDGNLPYASERLYINLFRARSRANVLYTKEDIDEDEYNSYLDKLFSDDAMKRFDFHLPWEIVRNFDTAVVVGIQQLSKGKDKAIADKSMQLFNKYRSFDTNRFLLEWLRRGKKFAPKGEAEKAIFGIVQWLQSYHEFFLPDDIELGRSSLNDVIEQLILPEWQDNAYEQTNLGRLWNVTRMYTTGKENIELWGRVWMYLGIDGIVDDDGRAMIHRGEATQAVFFNRQVVRQMKSFENTLTPDKIYQSHLCDRADVWKDIQTKHCLIQLARKRKGNLSGFVFVGGENKKWTALNSLIFTKAKFRDVFTFGSIVDCSFERATFSKAKILATKKVNGCNFAQSRFDESKLSCGPVASCNFQDSEWRNSELSSHDMIRFCRFDGSKFDNASIACWELRDVSFAETDMSGLAIQCSKALNVDVRGSIVVPSTFDLADIGDRCKLHLVADSRSRLDFDPKIWGSNNQIVINGQECKDMEDVARAAAKE